MMTVADIESWVRGGESETLELKRTTGERREAARTICAMLNHRGGRVIFGVESDGRLIGQMVSDRTVEEVAQELGEIEPPVFPSIERVDFAGERQLLLVTAQAGSGQPYAYRGHAYRRVGNTSRQLSREEYNRILLERLHGDQRWENQSATGWTLADLDVAEITKTLEESIRRGRADDPGTRDPAEMLHGFGLMKDGQILRAATVLFGRAEQIEAELPQGLLRVARFRGKDKTEFLDNRQFHGNAFDLLLKAERFLRENLPVAGRIQPNVFERIDDPLYPPVALREALANAFCHRDYSIGGGSISLGVFDDRLEITSTGTLHFGLTPEALYLPHESLPWNPLIARVFYRRGIIEAWVGGRSGWGNSRCVPVWLARRFWRQAAA
jgi:ATP-dependent DNA helicase RecG